MPNDFNFPLDHDPIHTERPSCALGLQEVQSVSYIYELSPEELVDKALKALQNAGIQLIEWKSLLYRRMGVPLIIKVCCPSKYHYTG